jgi:hypothetical protein
MTVSLGRLETIGREFSISAKVFMGELQRNMNERSKV